MRSAATFSIIIDLEGHLKPTHSSGPSPAPNRDFTPADLLLVNQLQLNNLGLSPGSDAAAIAEVMSLS